MQSAEPILEEIFDVPVFGYGAYDYAGDELA